VFLCSFDDGWIGRYQQELPEAFRARMAQIREKQVAKDALYGDGGHYFPPHFKEKMTELVNRAAKLPEGKEETQSIWL